MCVHSGRGRWRNPVDTVPALSRVGLAVSPLELQGLSGSSRWLHGERVRTGLCSITQLTATEHLPGAPRRPCCLTLPRTP